MPGRRVRRVAGIAGGLLILALAAAGAAAHRFANDRDPPNPAQPPPDLLRLFSDTRPVRIATTTPSWTKVEETVTVDRLRTDLTLWRRMHFGDWDRIPPRFREIGLAAMLRAYAPVVFDRSAWRRMTASDWDDVPQPIRAMAFLRMIWYWARVERLGLKFRLQPDHLAQTVAAIVMAESWFEHRAVNETPWGNRDLGPLDRVKTSTRGYAHAPGAILPRKPKVLYLSHFKGILPPLGSWPAACCGVVVVQPLTGSKATGTALQRSEPDERIRPQVSVPSRPSNRRVRPGAPDRLWLSRHRFDPRAARH